VFGGRIYSSDNSGDTWIEGNQTTDWGGISTSSDGVNLLSYGVNPSQSIWTSSDSGLTWVNRLQGAQNNNWSSCASSSTAVNLFVGGYGFIAVSQNSGANWTSVAIETNRYVVGIATTPDGSKVVCITNNSIYRSVNSGTSWVSVYNDGTQSFRGIASSSNGDILYASGSKGILKSIDAGATWTNIRPLNYYKISCSADGVIVMTYEYVTNPTTTQFIQVSSDSGATFVTQTSLGNRSWSGLVVSSDGNTFACCASNSQVFTGAYS
jgi:hypothetical protein